MPRSFRVGEARPPIQRALLAGDAETGITLMQMDVGLDTGPMLDVVRVPVGARETAGTLEDKLALAGASTLISYLRHLAAGMSSAPVPQPASGATYASKVQKSEAQIDWGASAAAIDRQVRAFDPAPGAVTHWSGERVKVWRARPTMNAIGASVQGTVLAADAQGIAVACGDGVLLLSELQPESGRRMSASTFAAGRKLVPGDRFGARGA